MLENGYQTPFDYSATSSYTDLACERYRADTDIPGVFYRKETTLGGVWEKIKITSREGAKSIGRPIGIYDTLHTERMDLLDKDFISDAQNDVAKELRYIFAKEDISPRRLLVAGLGNHSLTHDSVGCKAAMLTKPTMHIKAMDESFFTTLECSEIAVITPGVPSSTGLDSIVTVKGICEKIHPNAVIAIDSLVARDGERLGTTIQISSTGIAAGSGVGNRKSAITKDSLGIPVIAIGVPTVISSNSLCPENYSENKEKRKLQNSGGMLVCPKEIGEIVDSAAQIISGGISIAFGIYS